MQDAPDGVGLVCLEILQRGLSVIGSGWYEGKVSVQQEHFSSALAMRRLQAMIAANPPPSRPGRIISFAVTHTLC